MLREKRIWSKKDIVLNEQSTELSAQLHGLSCPQCNARKFTKHGKEKGNQRYRCSKCGKHFRSTTGNTIHHLHLKPKIQEYIDCMNQGLSLRVTARQLDISVRTAFRWRHRFLGAMRKSPGQLFAKSRVVSVYVLPFSRKSKSKEQLKHPPVTSILQIDATGNATINVLGRYGQHSWALLRGRQDKNQYIQSKSLPKFFKTNAVAVKDQEHAKVERQICTQITTWLAKFRGVATRYLENYWNWFVLKRQLQLQMSERSQYMYKCF